MSRHWSCAYRQNSLNTVRQKYSYAAANQTAWLSFWCSQFVVFLFFFKYIFLRSLPVKSQNCIILMAEQLQPVMIISVRSSKASHYFLQAQVQVLLAVSIAQAICIPGETDQWANQLVNGQVCLAAFMQQQQRLCCLHYYSWPTLSKKKRKEGWEGGKQGKLKQIWG